MWKRLRLAEADVADNVQNAPEVVRIAACDTAITDIGLPPIDSVSKTGIPFRDTTGVAASVLVALAHYQFCKPCGEAPAPDVPVSATSGI